MKVTSEGALVPQGQHQNVMAPENGLMMYDTLTSTFWYFGNSMWKEIGSDGDSSPTNELQSITASLTGDTMYLSNGGYLIVPGISAANHVLDADGNEYTTVKIGNQIWLKENLRTTKFNDGTPIPKVESNAEWHITNWEYNQLPPAFCWYNNDSVTYASVYGALYKKSVVDTSLNGGKNVCPLGFRVPRSADMMELVSFAGGEVAGKNLKSEGCSDNVLDIQLWSCSIHADPGTDIYGMTLKPAGSRTNQGVFFDPKQRLYLLTEPLDWHIGLSAGEYIHAGSFTDEFILDNYFTLIGYGMSIRCIKE
ncbi:MAG: fibrobacter succinogenes major paralogous domain-containing protein [Saprospiraceae bacterium]|nr:fibrobacter succinogenes major paralogous domain-containing protein [Saprospiraceae bacterium]